MPDVPARVAHLMVKLWKSDIENLELLSYHTCQCVAHLMVKLRKSDTSGNTTDAPEISHLQPESTGELIT